MCNQDLFIDANDRIGSVFELLRSQCITNPHRLVIYRGFLERAVLTFLQEYGFN